MGMAREAKVRRLAVVYHNRVVAPKTPGHCYCLCAARAQLQGDSLDATKREAKVKVKDLIAMLGKEDPEALVIKYNDGGTTATSDIVGLSQVPLKPGQAGPAILIE
jgi:hypothetical protein